MLELWDVTADKLEVFILVLFRLGGFFVIAPFWGHSQVPQRLRIAIALVLAWLVAPLMPAAGFEVAVDLPGLAALAVREMIAGGIIGFAYAILFFGVQSAGQAAGMQMGFAIVNVIDPHTEQSVSLLGQFKFILLMLIFLLIDGHHLVLQSLLDSFRVVPLGSLHTASLVPEKLIRLTGLMFVIAVKIAAPMIVTLLLTDVALGIVARTVPQMNIFIVGFPLKIGVGMLVLAASIPLLSYVFSKLLLQVQGQTTAIIAAMTGS
jgi:flagellar biosynthetic protein FliR